MVGPSARGRQECLPHRLMLDGVGSWFTAPAARGESTARLIDNRSAVPAPRERENEQDQHADGAYDHQLQEREAPADERRMKSAVAHVQGEGSSVTLIVIDSLLSELVMLSIVT